MTGVKSVLVIGPNPALIDFSQPGYAPGMTATKVLAGLKSSEEELVGLGYSVQMCLTDFRGTAEAVVRDRLDQDQFDCILIGAGVRTNPSNFLLFEKLINATAPSWWRKKGALCWSDQPGKGYEDHGSYRPRWLPVAIHLSSASPHEVTLVRATLEASFLEERPERLIGDKVYDSDPLGRQLAELGIELVAPNRSNQKNTQDGLPLRRYKRRWKVERLFALLQDYRRILTRFEYHADNYRGFVLLGCIIIL